MASYLFEFLDTNGDGTGERNARAIDEYYFEATNASTFIYRMIVNIIDTGPPVVNSYGNNITMTTGITFLGRKAGGSEQIITPIPIKNNLDWGLYCDSISLLPEGRAEGRIVVQWDFGKSGQPIELAIGDKLVIQVDDDLTALTGHYFQLQGYY
jgi:hypothetical protein